MKDGHFGQRVKILMAARGFKTQAKLAAVTGLDPSVVSRICNGRYNPTDEEKQKIKVALRWPSDDQAEAAFAILASAGDGEEP